MTLVDNLPVRVNRDPNSRKAAARVRVKVGSMRMDILQSIYRQAGFWTCERFDVRKGWLHQSASAQLNSLWRAGLITRDEEHVAKTHSGADEYIYELPVWLRSQWDGYSMSLDGVLQRNMHRLNLE